MRSYTAMTPVDSPALPGDLGVISYSMMAKGSHGPGFEPTSSREISLGSGQAMSETERAV
jgi:hypothetical protein